MCGSCYWNYVAYAYLARKLSLNSLARGGGRLAPESPTVNEGASTIVAPQVVVLVVVLAEAATAQRILANN